MRQTNFKVPRIAAAAILLAASLPDCSMAQQQGQKTFSSPEDASNALVTAAQSNDEKAMLEILGPDGKQIVSSGDETEDANNRANFVQRYQEMHRLVKEPDGTTTLYIGAENWPMPIPLVNKGNSWYFNTEAGKTEILCRRIGRNEISTIRVCQELVAAEKEYYSTQHNEYAQKFFSDEGQHNGLYWKAADGEPQSPIGPLVASAAAEGYVKSEDGAPTPYRGYYFRIPTRRTSTCSLSTPSARFRWTACRRPTPGILEHRWRWRQWLTAYGSSSFVSILRIPSGRTAIVSCCQSVMHPCCSTRSCI